jgi:hypothetical protein
MAGGDVAKQHFVDRLAAPAGPQALKICKALRTFGIVKKGLPRPPCPAEADAGRAHPQSRGQNANFGKTQRCLGSQSTGRFTVRGGGIKARLRSESGCRHEKSSIGFPRRTGADRMTVSLPLICGHIPKTQTGCPGSCVRETTLPGRAGWRGRQPFS